jgi:biopolymer transport protein ExbB
MLDNKRMTPLIAMFGAVALLASSPTFAQTAAPPAATSSAPDASSATSGAASAAPAADSGTAAPAQINGGNKLTIASMLSHASLAVQMIMGGLFLCSVLSLIIFITKLLEFANLNKASDNFLEAFRSAKSISDINRIATSEEYEGTPMADMAAAATTEIELSRQAGLNVVGEFRDSTINRSSSAVQAVQALLSKRLGGGMTFLASVGSNGPFVGLFGTVIGIMISFISIANTHTTSLASVAPGIAEALLATAFGLGAAIPAVIFYNIFQARISAYGTRAEGFVAELMNALSRQLDKGA